MERASGGGNVSVFKLHLQIEIGKLRLVEMAGRYGLDDPRVLRESQRLDRLIAELQRRRAS